MAPNRRRKWAEFRRFDGDFPAVDDVTLHDGPLVVAKTPGREQDFLRGVQLADIVHDSTPRDERDLIAIERHPLGDSARPRTDRSRMGCRRNVVGADLREPTFDDHVHAVDRSASAQHERVLVRTRLQRPGDTLEFLIESRSGRRTNRCFELADEDRSRIGCAQRYRVLTQNRRIVIAERPQGRRDDRIERDHVAENEPALAKTTIHSVRNRAEIHIC